MRLFFKATKSDEERSRELSNKLKNLNPKANDAEIEKVSQTILKKHEELERAVRLRDFDRSYRLRFEVEALYGKKLDLERQAWKERDMITFELRELNEKVIEHCLEWLSKMMLELDTQRNIEEMERKTNPVNMTVEYTTRNNFQKVEDLQNLLIDARKQIRNMAGCASISEIEKIYLDTIEKIPPEIPCTEELQCNEETFTELRERINDGMDRGTTLNLATLARYGRLI